MELICSVSLICETIGILEDEDDDEDEDDSKFRKFGLKKTRLRLEM
jgi:hypothetical protein